MPDVSSVHRFRARGALVALAAVSLQFGAAGQALAEGSGYDVERLSQTGFVTAAANTDSVPGGALLLAAYVVFFFLIAAYVAVLAGQHSRTTAELGEIRKRLEDLDDRLEAGKGRK